MEEEEFHWDPLPKTRPEFVSNSFSRAALNESLREPARASGRSQRAGLPFLGK